MQLIAKLVASIFSFCHYVFYHIKTQINMSGTFNFCSADPLSLGLSKILLFGKGLSLPNDAFVLNTRVIFYYRM